MGNTPSTHSTDSGASQDISSGSGAGSAGTTGAAADGRGSKDALHNRFGGSNRKSSAEAKGGWQQRLLGSSRLPECGTRAPSLLKDQPGHLGQ